MPPLRVAVIGAGAFGRNHLRVYRELEFAHPDLVQLAALVEPDDGRRNAFAATYNIPAFATTSELLGAPQPALSSPKGPDFQTWVDAASICVPTIHHAEIAEQLLLAGIDILIEKPFATTLAETDRILDLAHTHCRIVAIGHLERFNPAVTETIAALNQPMFFEAHRLSVFTPRSLDVDVVLDLMIHDLDIVLSLTQSPIKEVRAVGLPILSRKTDIANVRVEFDSGCVANFTASRVSTEQVRKLRLFQPHQYLSLDFARQELLTISVDPSILTGISTSTVAPKTLSSQQEPGRTQTLSSQQEPGRTQQLSSRPKAALFAAAAERPAAPPEPPPRRGDPNPLPPRPDLPGAPCPNSGTWDRTTNAAAGSPAPHHPTPGLTLTKSDIPKAEPLRLELEDFLHAVRTRAQPRVPAQAGRAALSLALTINQQIAAHAHHAGLL